MNQPQPNWWGRNWKWAVPSGCLVLVALAIGGVVLMMSLVFGMMKSSDAYTHALAAARANAAVVAAIGEPIEAGYFVSGEVKINGPTGVAELAIPVSGPKGAATIYASARKAAGQWNYSTLVVEIDATHERIDLLEGP